MNRERLIPTHGSVPVPDPTALTTEALTREFKSLRELLESRLDGNDKALTLLQANIDKSPTPAELFAKYEEKFRGIATQFLERDTTSREASLANTTSIQTAFMAAKEAVAKSEASTIKSLDQIGDTIIAANKSNDTQLGDIKERLTMIEGRSQGRGDFAGYVVAGISVMYGIVMTIMGFYRH